MKKILSYLIALIVIGGAAWWFSTQGNSKGSLSVDEMEFAWEDTASLSKIFLADLGGKEITLVRQGSRWEVNEKYSARPAAMEYLLKTIAQLRVRYPVSKSQHNTIIKEIAAKHTKVELYDEAGENVKTYYVGPPTKNYRGNFMKTEKGKQAHIVHIPGLDGFLHTRYILDEEDWRDRKIFSTPIDQIKELSVNYTFNPDSSFRVYREADQTYKLELVKGQLPDREMNLRATYAYLDYFRNIECEALINDFPQKDSVLLSQPIAEISLTDVFGGSQSCQLFYRPITKRSKSQFDAYGNPLEYSQEKYYAAFNDSKDLALVQDFVFGKLFVGYGWFYQKEPQENDGAEMTEAATEPS